MFNFYIMSLSEQKTERTMSPLWGLKTVYVFLFPYNVLSFAYGAIRRFHDCGVMLSSKRVAPVMPVLNMFGIS